MGRIFTAAVLRPILQELFPDVEDGRSDDHRYEHPMTAVGVVLMRAAIMSTIETTALMLFTGYSRRFISAIACNMQNNQLWIDGRYDVTGWLPPDGTIDGECLWTHIELACGNEWMPLANLDIAADPCMIYWDERGGFS